jgi:prophage antirepressor-like protein
MTLTMQQIGELLAMKHPSKGVSHIYNTNQDEFDNDCTHISITETRDGGPPRRERVFTIEGLILICMRSDQPNAKKVRKWLRKVGREVAVTGQYNSPVLNQLLNLINETVLCRLAIPKMIMIPRNTPKPTLCKRAICLAKQRYADFTDISAHLIFINRVV